VDSVRKIWAWVATPTVHHALGVLVAVGILLGVGGRGAFDFAMHQTSTDSFCLSCHELEINIGIEFENMSHAKNASGVRTTCSDCHLPKPFVPKMMRKFRAVGEIYHHLLGTIDTPEKFEAHRMTMATRVWAEMNQTDSRECRNCHNPNDFDFALQSEKGSEFHGRPLMKGKTCIDCHKGIAHKLPEGITADEQLAGMNPASEAEGG
jgi:cytochrome c-type protein NapC